MKYKRWLNSLLALPFIAILGWLSFSRPDLLLNVGKGTGLMACVLLILIFTPLGSISLGNDPKTSLFQWWLSLLKGHAVILLFTFTCIIAFFGTGPSFLEGKFSFSIAETVVKDYFWEWGILPWSLFGLWGLTVAYVAYVKKWPPYLYGILINRFPKRLEPAFKISLNITVMGATVLVIAMLVGAITLLLSYPIEIMVGVGHFTVSPFTFGILSFLMLAFVLKPTRKALRRWHQKITLNRLITFTIVSLIILFALASFAAKLFLAAHPEVQSQLKCQQCEQMFDTVSLETRFAALYYSWWLIWVPLAGSFLAAHAKGRTIREFLIGLFSFPLIGWLLLEGLAGTNLINEPWMLSKSGMLIFLILVPFVAWGVLAKMFKNISHSQFLQTGYMNVSENFAKNRLWLNDASKNARITKYAPNIILTIVGTLLLHTTAGWYGLQVQLLAMAVLLILFCYVGTVWLLLRFL